MKHFSFLLLASLLAGPGLAQGVRTDGAIQLVLDGAIHFNVDGNVALNPATVVVSPVASTFKVSGGSQNIDFGSSSNNLGTFQLEGTGTKTLQRDLLCSFLVVNAGTTLSLPTGIDLTAVGQVSYAGGITVGSGAALIQSLGSTLGTTSGTFTVQRNDTGGSPASPRYNYWASPVQNFPVASVPAFVLNGVTLRYAYNNATSAWENALAGNMGIGVGYAAVNAGNMSFVGVPHNGDLGRSIGPGFNLLGNPYPSPIGISTFMGLNTSLDGAAWFWNDNGGYVNLTGTGNYVVSTGVNPGTPQVANAQGFFVQRTGAAITAVFSNTQRQAGNPTFFRPEEAMERFQLGVATADGLRDYVLLGFRPDFTAGFDRGYDGEKMDGNPNISLAAIQDGKKYMNLALPHAQGRFELPLSLHASKAGAYTFAAQEIEGATGQKLFLEDRQMGEFYYLQPGRSHTLNLSAGNYRDRFYLRTSSEVVGQAQAGETANAYSFGRELFVEASETSEVSVYNQLGVRVAHFADVKPGALRRLPVGVLLAGVYVVRMATATNTVEKRVWLDK
jgi:hypothetical protein